MSRLGRLSIPLLLSLTCVAQAPKNITYVRVHPSIVRQRVQVPDTATWSRALKKQFVDSGFSADQISEQVVPGQASQNLLCTIPGSGSGTIVVATRLELPRIGANEKIQWASLALLPLLAEAVNGMTPQHTFVFAAFAGHDRGQTGQAAYLDQLSAEQRRNVLALVDIDSVGRAAPTFRTSRKNTLFRNLLPTAASAAKASPAEPAEIETEVGPFDRAGVPSITFSSWSLGTQRNLTAFGEPTSTVPLRELDFSAHYDTYSMLSVYLVYLDRSLAASGSVTDVSSPAIDEPAEQHLFALLNKERAQSGLATLQFDQRLVEVARAHSSLMASRRVAKKIIEGEPEVQKRQYAARVRAVHGSEIVAFMPEAVSDLSKVESEYSAMEDRKELLNPELNAAGIGVVRENGSLYVTIELASAFNLNAEDAEKALAARVNTVRTSAGKSPLRFNTSKQMREAMCTMATTRRMDAGALRNFARPGSNIYLYSGAEPTLSPEHLKELTATNVSDVSVGICDTAMEYWVGVVTN